VKKPVNAQRQIDANNKRYGSKRKRNQNMQRYAHTVTDAIQPGFHFQAWARQPAYA
jgi:hypothetical protein